MVEKIYYEELRVRTDETFQKDSKIYTPIPRIVDPLFGPILEYRQIAKRNREIMKKLHKNKTNAKIQRRLIPVGKKEKPISN